jgi:hypothetical protein
MDQNVTYQAPIPRPKGAADFDFLVGEWRVRNRRLKLRLAGIDTADQRNWEEFETRYRMWPLVGGLANVDSQTGTFNGEYFEGVSFREFEAGEDGAPGRWRIWWTDTSNPRLTEQVLGAFADTPPGRTAEFFGEEIFDGRMTALRFRWIDPGDGTARWDQAYQYPEGHEKANTWEVNWVMEFTRALR